MSAEAIAIVAVGVTLLAVLVPLMLALNHGVRSDVADVRRGLQALGERVARIEGRLDALAPVMTPVRARPPRRPNRRWRPVRNGGARSRRPWAQSAGRAGAGPIRRTCGAPVSGSGSTTASTPNTPRNRCGVSTSAGAPSATSSPSANSPT